MHFYEDLITIHRSSKLLEAAINRKDRVLNVQNKRRGVSARRWDGTFGELIPGETAITDAGYLVSRGPIATVEIGVEVKVLAKAMIKQIDRVKNDLRHQVTEFKLGGGSPICIAVVGINQAESMTSYEGDRPWPTTGAGGFLHPFQEAPEAERSSARSRSRSCRSSSPDRSLVRCGKRAVQRGRRPCRRRLRGHQWNLRGRNDGHCEWVNYKDTRLDYAAALSRVSARYQQRF